MTDRRTGLEVLDRETCLRLLAGEELGRLAIWTGGGVFLVPVNFALDRDTIVVRTDPGTKLDNAGRASAAFEIDGTDRETRSGWSVVVTGRLEEVESYDVSTFARVTALALEPWAGGEKEHWLRLVPTRITGRRIAAQHR